MILTLLWILVSKCYIVPVFALSPDRKLSHFIVTNWQTEAGLPDNMVHYVMQNSDSYLWLGTTGGLVRFDGHEFKVFLKKQNPVMPSNLIVAIREDKSGDLWLGTDAGLVIYSKGKFKAFLKNSASLHRIFGFFDDNEGNLWSGTNGNGVIRYNFITGAQTHFNKGNGLSGNYVRSIFKDNRGRLWVGTRNGLNRLQNGKFIIYTSQMGLPFPFIRKIFQDSKGNLWMGSYGGGLFKVTGETGKEKFVVYDTSHGLPSNYIRTIYEDSAGTLWIGSRKGLTRMLGNTFETCLTEASDPYNLVNSICEDSERNLWVGTESKGLFRLKEGAFRSFSASEGLSNSAAWSVIQDSKKNVWVGMRSGLYRMKAGESTFNKISTTGNVFHYGVNSIAEDGNGNLWVGMESEGVIKCMDGDVNRRFNYSVKNGLAGNTTRFVFIDQEPNRGDVIWIGSYDNGLTIIDGERIIRYDSDNGLPGDFVKFIIKDRMKQIWVATDKGLARYDKTQKTFETFSTVQGLSGNNITVIQEDYKQDGLLWIGTFENGLNRFYQGKFTHYSYENGLHDEAVNLMLQDKSGDLWLGGPKGLSRVNRRDLMDIAANKKNRLTLHSFNESDGMKIRQCTGGETQPACAADSDGKLWFATARGIVLMDTHKLQPNTFTPPVHIQRVMVDDRIIDSFQMKDQNFSFTQGIKNLEFHYTAPSFYAPEKLKFNFMLEGLDTDWRPVQNRRVAYYTTVPTGNYRFKVRLENSNGEMKSESDTFTFKVTPFFYQTVWFHVLMILGGLTLIAGLALLRVSRLKSHKRELEHLVEERTRQIEETNKELEKLSVVARETDNAVIIMDGKGNLEWVNEKFTRMTGLTLDEFVKARGRNIIDASWNPDIQDILRTCIKEQKPVLYDTSSVNRTGKESYYQSTVTPIFDETGRLVRLVVISSNISAIKESELKIKKQNQEILTRTLELQKALQTARKEREAARAANQAKSEFLARMSHEIRTPLNGIIGFTDMLSKSELNREQLDCVFTISRSGDALTTLLNDILDVSKIEAGELNILNEDFNPRHVIDDVFEIVRPRLEDKPVKMWYTIDPNLPRYVKGDSGRFRQILTNLVGNAAKFTQTGEIEMTLDVKEMQKNLKLHFKVRDTGIGIPTDKLESIFEVFQQVDGSNTRQYDGAGLGLAISRQIAHLLNGDVWAESILKQGSTFHFTLQVERGQLPRLQKTGGKPRNLLTPEPGVSELDAPRSVAGTGNLNILLVEDNPINQKLAHFILSKAGYNIHSATNGAEAVDLFTAGPQSYDLIFMDVQMPKLNGLDATRRIRQEEEILLKNATYRRIPIIAMTAQSMKGDRERCIRSGMDDYISKPIKSAQVLDMVNQWRPRDKNGESSNQANEK